MKKKKIVVVGGTNTDMVVKSPRFPVPGESIVGGNFFMNAGGKGANQAVAAARLGDDVVFQNIADANRSDVESATQKGRSTTRLILSEGGSIEPHRDSMRRARLLR